MGNCAPSGIMPDKSKVNDPSIYYLNRSDAFVLYVTQSKTQKMRFANKKSFPKDCSLGYLTDSSVIIAGGTNNHGKLTDKVYKIDLLNLQIEKLTPLPIPSKLGSLFVYNDSVYYAGGMTEIQNDNQSGESYKGAPIMRYDINENYWDTILHKYETSECKDLEKHNFSFSIEDLTYPGVFCVRNKLYYYGGKMINNQVSPNRNIYSVNLSSPSYDLIVEPYIMPIPLLNPVSASYGKQAFIFGGTTLTQDPSSACFLFNVKKGFIQIKTPFLYTNENYPPKFCKDYIIAVSFPCFAVKFKNSSAWLQYNVSLNQKLKSQTVLIRSNSEQKGSFHLPNIRQGTIQKPRLGSPDIKFTYSDSMGFNNSPKAFINAVQIRLTFSNQETEEKCIEEKLNNSLNNSKTIENFESNGLMLVPQELSIAMIVSEENDGYISVPRKKAIQFLGRASNWLNGSELNPLEVNLLSRSLGFKIEVTICEIKKSMEKIITVTNFDLQKILKYCRIINKIFDKPKIKNELIAQILDVMKIKSYTDNVSRSKCILILTRVIKALDLKIS